MSRDVLTCEPDTDLARAGWLMWEGDCGALPVVIEGEVVGMITDRDLALAAALFSAAHLDPAHALHLAAIGMVLAWIVSRSGSLYPGMILHALINTAGLLSSW